MSRWTHAICMACWNAKNPDREPIAIREEFRDESADPCCYCGKPQQSGIFVRESPEALMCKGEGAVHED